MTIIATPPTSVQCPRWCAAHLPTGDDTVHHIGIDQRIDFRSVQTKETSRAHITVEQFDFAGQPPVGPEVYVDMTSSAMTPAQALELSAALEREAIRAQPELEAEVEWARTKGWAHKYIRVPAATPDEARIQAIVADLLSQVEAGGAR